MSTKQYTLEQLRELAYDSELSGMGVNAFEDAIRADERAKISKEHADLVNYWKAGDVREERIRSDERAKTIAWVAEQCRNRRGYFPTYPAAWADFVAGLAGSERRDLVPFATITALLDRVEARTGRKFNDCERDRLESDFDDILAGAR